ncbi:YhdP family protein [Colwellia asteriadis]|uniref:YhdP family protein n=1 Tax=Colwellia asteriadis TaxID=517723 RepID=A0ABP3WDZ6_9GAMM
MSIARTSNRWLNRLYKAVAVLVVLVAVLISAFRLFLPYVPHYKEDFQNYINNQNQTKLTIGSLAMTWQGVGPTLLVGDVIVLDSEQAQFKITELAVQIDFWRSVTTGRLISDNLVLSGAHAVFDQKLLQESSSADASNHNFEIIANLFLNRINQFSLRNSQIIVRDDKKDRHFHINKLNWSNEDDRHQAEGTVVVNGLSSNNLQVKVNLQGDNINNLTGPLYLQANHIDITPWLNKVLALEGEKAATDINFSAWLNVERSTLNSLQVELGDSTISWLLETGDKTLTFEKGQLLLSRGSTKDHFDLFSTPLVMHINDEVTQEIKINLAKQGDSFSAHLSSIDLALFSHLPPLFLQDKNQHALLEKLALVGSLDDVFIKYSQGGLSLYSDFSGVSNHFSQGIPGLDNVSGDLSFVDNYLTVNLLAEQGSLDFAEHFVAPFPYKTLTAQANIDFSDVGWSLQVNQLDFVSSAINLSAQVRVTAPQNEGVTMALLANVSDGDAGMVGKYLPLSIMSEDLVSYLNNAIIAGQLTQAQVLLNGPLKSFPYTDGSGIFVVDAELTNSTFKFAEQWPAITNFAANLNFTNNAMLITGREGSLSGLDVEGVKVGINDLAHKQVLTVDAPISSVAAKHVNQLITQSPLKDSVGSALSYLGVSGDISGQFELMLPLNALDDVVASGLINFSNNSMKLAAPEISLHNIVGQLTFVNDKINTEALSLTWQDLPLNIAVTGANKPDYYDTDIMLSAHWQPKAWQQHIPESLTKYLSGDIDWQGKLSLHQHNQGGFSYDFNLKSDLTNTALDLPAPYHKNLTTTKNFTAQVSGQLDKSQIAVDYNEQLSFFGVLDHDTSAFSRAHLVVGDDTMLLPMDGFHITTKLDQADIASWQPFISDVLNSINDNKRDPSANYQPLLSAPERIRGTVAELDVLGQKLHNVSFNLLDKQDWWLLQLNAKETRSQVKFYPDWLEQGIEVNAEFIHLNQQPKNENLSDIATVAGSLATIENSFDDEHYDDGVFANMPPIKLHCDRCQIGLLNLGKVDFTLERDGDVLKIPDFTAKREQANINFALTWLKNSDISQTTIVGEMAINSVEHELSALGYDSIIRDSGGKMEFNLDWQGGVHQFDLAQLNGKFQAKLDDGYLADVPDKARIFSVLSLQSLVRKLTLDFRDIFSDGMFYSSIKGDYQVREGVLYTNNTQMDGTAGNLLMTGNTHLINGELNYNMSYKPNLSSSLPVMAWIVTLNPVTFLAGVAIDQVIKSQVVSEFNFALTGTVNEPDFKMIDRKMKDVSVGGDKADMVDTADYQGNSTPPNDKQQLENQHNINLPNNEAPHLKQYKSPLHDKSLQKNKQQQEANSLSTEKLNG